jgi:hypothetical protein
VHKAAVVAVAPTDGKILFPAGFRELTDTRLGKEEFTAADNMLLIRRKW